MAVDDPRILPSASSSFTQGPPVSKADQVVHRVYLKTVGVLVESRLTHYGGSKGAEKKKDKWFNLVMPEIDLHRQDLRIYQSISMYPSSPGSSIPPLLIAFVLDTSDIPSGQALLWNRANGKVTLDPTLGRKGKGKEREARSGIVLERWTFTASSTQSGPSSSQQSAPQAYRLGIIHFRALYSLVRLLPAYRLFRRLRRNNTGLKLGLKLWSPEGLSSDAASIQAAWDIMERDLVGIEAGLEELGSPQTEREEDRKAYTFPSLDMFGLEYSLGVEYRSEVDFHIEDMESVLSEKFADMAEDWFTPTVARHRIDDEARSSASASAGSSVPTGHALDMSGLEKPDIRRSSGPTPIPSTTSNPSPIPLRQGPASIGSFRGSVGRTSSSRIPSGLGMSKEGITPGSIGRWGVLGEGLPFATAATPRSPGYIGTPDPLSPLGNPSGAAITARRLSGHSIHPHSSTTSLLRPTPSSQSSQAIRPLGSSKPSSIGRTSSFLSQSGRSFTHAQLASISQRTSQPVAIATSMSPPLPGTSSNMSMPSPEAGGSSGSPSSFSFTKQPLRSLTSRPPFASSIASPFAPSSLDKDANLMQGSPGAPPQIIKRYSSYSARRDRLAGSPASAIVGSQGSSGEGTSQASAGMLRRTSMRTSYEAGLRRSMEHSGSGSGSRSGSGSGLAKIVAEDSDDIEAFLKTLDSLPQPPTIAAQSVHASRSHLPSTSSSLSVPSFPASPSPLGDSPKHGPVPMRTPTTRAQIDAQLRRMAGSFQQHNPTVAPRTAAIARSSSVASGASIGLLSASRPATASRGISQPSPQYQPAYRRAPISPPHSSNAPANSPANLALPPPTSVARKPSARSLPGSGTAQLQDEEPQQLRSAGIAIPPNPLGMLSPQTTGGTTIDTASTSTSGRSRRGRGPVLLRGGFGDPKSERGPASYAYAKSSVSSSPSHSPSRDFGRLTLVQREREQRAATGAGVGYGERQAEEELDSWNRTAAGMGMTGTGVPVRQGYAGYPGIPPTVQAQSHGVGKVEQEKARARVGLGTAPGSFADSRGSTGEAGLEGDVRVGRGRQGRVKSEGGGGDGDI